MFAWVHHAPFSFATLLNLKQGRGADATQYTVKWIHDSIVELSRLDREMKPAAILQMAYVMTMTHSFVNCPETLINEKERFQMISIELRKQVRFFKIRSFFILSASVLLWGHIFGTEKCLEEFSV